MPHLPAVPAEPVPRSVVAPEPLTPVATVVPPSGFPEPRTAPDDLGPTIWELTLYVTGATMSSARAISFVRLLCDAHLPDRHRLTVVDVSDELAAVPPVGVLAAPSLVRRHPLPERRWYGDLSDADRVLVGLQITPPGGPSATRTLG